MIAAVRTQLARLSLRSKLVGLYLLFGILPVMLLAGAFYQLSLNILLEKTAENLQAITAKNNELVESRLKRIDEAALMLTVDQELHSLMNPALPPGNLEILHGSREIKRILDRYFMGISGIFACHMYTDCYMMAGNIADPAIPNSVPSMYVPYEEFVQSDLYRAAREAGGKLVWYPTYEYESMYDLEEYRNIDYNYPYLFSAVKQINCLDDSSREEPILIVSFLPEFFGGIVRGEALEADGASCFIVSQDQGMIYAQGDRELADELLSAISDLDSQSGKARLRLNDQEYLVVYDTLTYTGWKQLVAVPNHAYTGSLSALPGMALAASALLAVILTVLVCVTTSNIIRNLKMVIAGMARLGDGEFMIHLPEAKNDEFGFLARRFNEMDERIHALIVENYEIKLREKEAQIMALNLQLNPHFLYNTLSTISWMAVDAGQSDIVEAISHLSNMLQQSFRNKCDTCTVEEDLNWLRDYLYIMNLRFENRFTVDIRMDPGLIQTRIPRSIFQPVLENTIVHGFEDMDAGGKILLEGRIENDGFRVFRIKDNGSGFEPGRVEAVLNVEADGVGLSNLNHRLQILYKGRYTLKIHTAICRGTEVIIRLPPQ